MGNGTKLSPITIGLAILLVISYFALGRVTEESSVIFAAVVAVVTGLYVGIVVAEADEAHQPDKEFPTAFLHLAYLLLGGLAFYFWTSVFHSELGLPARLAGFAVCYLIGIILWAFIKPKPKKDVKDEPES